MSRLKGLIIPPALAILLAAAPHVKAAWADQCPQSCIDFDTPIPSCSVAAQRESTQYGWILGFDLRAGTVHGSGQWYDGGGSDAWARDSYHLIGPTGGSPPSFTAKLRCRGSAYGPQGSGHHHGGNGGVHVSLTENSLNSISFAANAPQTQVYFDTTLTLTLAHVVGEQFQLEIHASQGGINGGSASDLEELSFAGLPPGYAVVSCEGYISNPVVSVRRDTWGRLKLSYRSH